jgi:hypothetical protein
VDSHRYSAFHVSLDCSRQRKVLTDSLGDCGCVIARQVVTYTHPNANIPSANPSTYRGNAKVLTVSLSGLIPTYTYASTLNMGTCAEG